MQYYSYKIIMDAIRTSYRCDIWALLRFIRMPSFHLYIDKIYTNIIENIENLGIIVDKRLLNLYKMIFNLVEI